VRQVQREWAGGGLRGLQAERDRFWSSLGLLPIGRGEGVGAGPREAAVLIGGLHATARRHGAIHGGRPYFAAGGELWRPERVGSGLFPGNLGGATQLGATLAQTFDGLCSDGGDLLYLARGQAAGFVRWTVGGSAFDTSPTVPLSGCAWYVGSLWGGTFDGVTWRLARCTGPTAYESPGWPLDSAPRAFAVVRDGLYVGTGGGLWRARGAVVGGAFVGEVALLATGGATAGDFVALAEYGGELYTWAAGEVMRYHVTASGGAALAPVGLRGWSCRGLVAVGGYLFAAVVTGLAGSDVGLWAYDGAGWWCLGRNLDGLHDYCWPLGMAGYFDNADLLSFGNGSSVAFGAQLRARSTQAGLAPGGELTTSLWHGRDPDKLKGWTRVGAELAWPDGATFGPCTATLAYSVDGGATFVAAGSATVAGAAAQTLSFALPLGTAGKWLALRYTLAGVTTGAPTLAALWAEYRAMESPERRRHWVFDVLATDGLIGRAGAPESRDGATIAAELWAAWEGGGTLLFRDLDYDLAPIVRAVRIAGLEEAIGDPADAGRWGDSRVRVRLVEV